MKTPPAEYRYRVVALTGRSLGHQRTRRCTQRGRWLSRSNKALSKSDPTALDTLLGLNTAPVRAAYALSDLRSLPSPIDTISIRPKPSFPIQNGMSVAKCTSEGLVPPRPTDPSMHPNTMAPLRKRRYGKRERRLELHAGSFHSGGGTPSIHRRLSWAAVRPGN